VLLVVTHSCLRVKNNRNHISVAHTLLIEGVSQCPTRVMSNTNTCDFIELCHFLNFNGVDVSVLMSCLMCLCQCFIDNHVRFSMKIKYFKKVFIHSQIKVFNTILKFIEELEKK